MTTIEIRLAEEGDWFWIIEKHAETAWASLPSDLREELTTQAVRAALADQTTQLRLEHGETNQVFIARRREGQLAGYIWVGQVKSGFTGAMQAYVFQVFVEETFRGQGIGALLLTQAENWAREHQLGRIGLSVSAFNTGAIELYEKLAYKVETLRMIKNLA